MESTAGPAATPKRFPRLLRIFEPAPHIPPIQGEEAIQHGYRIWRSRVLVSTIIGYAAFYLVRKNLSVAMPFLRDDLHLNNKQLGFILTVHGVLYGVSKFVNGFFADRCNARTMMSIGLAVSALLNICFGFSSVTAILAFLWMANGWFQGMGFPPVSRLMVHWFSPKELATKMSIWNTAHCLGGVLTILLCGFLVAAWGWRSCFFVPFGIAIVCAVYLWIFLADTPESVGLPEVEGTQARTPVDASDDFKRILVRHVFSKPYIWLVSIGNFFVYIVRYAVLDWGITMLKDAKHMEVANGKWIVAGFEFAGMFGMLAGGWLTDRLFGGRSIRVCTIYMGLTAASVFLFWKVAGESTRLNLLFIMLAGFFIYGPQALVAIAAANLATKRAAATACGMTGLFGYASTLVSGVGLGAIVDAYGWDTAIMWVVIAAIIGMAVFALGWWARPDGYDD
jgi:OPA family glycerol-3-phosphate transporter-like MFS transporter/OPA family sugar phosphate sensor protein UhpC-like MFS transporter